MWTARVTGWVQVPLQVFANVAIVVLDEYTPAARSWFT
jgi:hypothetical protein